MSLTRAKKELYLFVPHENQSSFMHEILEDNNIILKKSDKVLNTVYCSKCHAEMKLRTNEYGIEFYGCSNYPKCTYTKSKNQEQNIVCCPICQSEMSIRVNKKGEKFYGCSNYPKCKGTRSI